MCVFRSLANLFSDWLFWVIFVFSVFWILYLLCRGIHLQRNDLQMPYLLCRMSLGFLDRFFCSLKANIWCNFIHFFLIKKLACAFLIPPHSPTHTEKNSLVTWMFSSLSFCCLLVTPWRQDSGSGLWYFWVDVCVVGGWHMTLHFGMCVPIFASTIY